MTDNQETPTRDWKQFRNIGLAVLATIIAGIAIGWALAGTGSRPTTTTVAAVGSSTLPGAPTTTTPLTPPSTDVPGQMTLTVLEDTYVDEETPTEVNGLSNQLEVEDDPPEITRSLLRFEVSGLPEGETVRSAILRLYVVDDGEDAVGVHLVNGEWSQDTTNASNAPAVGEAVSSIAAPGPEGLFVDVDVTSVVTGPGVYDFYLVPSGGDSIAFASGEDTANAPVLVVRWLDGPPQSASTTTTEPDETAGGPDVPLLDGEPAVLVGAGDIADCEGSAPLTAALLDETIAEYPQAAVFTAGDNAYGEGTAEEFRDCYDPTWGRHRDRTRPSPGNHDYQTDGASGYFGYFGGNAGSPTNGYYSYELGSWQVLALNSNCSDIGGCEETSPQGQWLRDELAASDALCTVAYMHHPLFSSGQHGGDDDVRDLVKLLHDDGAEVLVAGHDHNYERFAPQTADGASDPESGVRLFVVGTGGRSLRDFGTPAPNSEVRESDSYGVLELILFENGYEWEFVPAAGSTFTDQGTGVCH